MDLQSAINHVQELTQGLHEALENQDLELCGNLLDQRGQAMATFEKCHRKATANECAACRDGLASVAKANALLQERSRAILELVTEEFRGQLGSPVGGSSTTGGDQPPACLDRKV